MPQEYSSPPVKSSKETSGSKPIPQPDPEPEKSDFEYIQDKIQSMEHHGPNPPRWIGKGDPPR